MKVLVRAYSIIATLCLALVAIGCGELSSTEYKNFAELQKAPPTARLWLPDFLPASATLIWESHNIDTNTVVGEFKFDRKDFEPITAKLTELPRHEATKAMEQAKRLSKRVAISGGARAFSWVSDSKSRGLIVIDSQASGAVFWTERT